MALRLHLDEHLGGALASALRRRGLDVTTTKDAGLLGASDEDHLRFGLQEGRVVVTVDDDYLRLHASGHFHAGLIFCPPHKNSLRYLIRHLSSLAESGDPALFENDVFYL